MGANTLLKTPSAEKECGGAIFSEEERRNRQHEEYRIRFRQRATLLGIGLIFLVTAVLLIVGCSAERGVTRG